MSRAPSTKPAVTPPGMKWCPSGEHFAPLAAFARDRTKADGLLIYCRRCNASYRKAHYIPRPRKQREKPVPAPRSSIYLNRATTKRQLQAARCCTLCTKDATVGEDGFKLCTGPGSCREKLDLVLDAAKRRRHNLVRRVSARRAA